MRVTDIFEHLSPRMLWDDHENVRFVVNGYFYDEFEASLMDALLVRIGAHSKWYRRNNAQTPRRANEIILQLSGDSAIHFLRYYKWKDKRKRFHQEMILRELDSRNELNPRPHRCLQGAADDAGACECCGSTAR